MPIVATAPTRSEDYGVELVDGIWSGGAVAVVAATCCASSLSSSVPSDTGQEPYERVDTTAAPSSMCAPRGSLASAVRTALDREFNFATASSLSAFCHKICLRGKWLHTPISSSSSCFLICFSVECSKALAKFPFQRRQSDGTSREQ